MIQDRELQGLWDAVEEIRKRVEKLEDTGASMEVELVAHAPVAAVKDGYVASATSSRKTFHLRGCKFVRSFIDVPGRFSEFTTAKDAIAAGMVPCKLCEISVT